MKGYLGKIGIVVATCRPAGMADFDGVKLDVVTRGEYIEKGAMVDVIEVEGNRIVVKVSEPSEPKVDLVHINNNTNKN